MKNSNYFLNSKYLLIAAIHILAGCISLTAQNWQQKGPEINGESSGDYFGFAVSMSADGNTIAVGTPWNDAVISLGGHVQVYTWNGTSWIQKGIDFDANSSEGIGNSVSLSDDGNILAIGAPHYYNTTTGNYAGHVSIYEWTGSTWLQRGSSIEADAAGDHLGWCVDLNSNGNTIAIGAPRNDANGSESGQTKVFDWSGASWVQRGADILGDTIDDACGWYVSLSANGNILATSSYFDDGTGADAGTVRVYNWNGASWQQLGTNIDGEAAGDRFGFALSLSANGYTLCAGGVDNTNANGFDSGHARVFTWNGSAWLQKGNDIDGESSPDRSGHSTSISADGNTIAIGAINNSNANGSYAGQIRVYNWNGSAWIQKGIDIDGEANNNVFGYSVSMSADGNTLIAGAIGNDDAGNDAGSATVYTCFGLNFIQNVQCGGSYTSPSGSHTWNSSGTYYDTLQSVNGCDSITMFNLIFNAPPVVSYSEIQNNPCLDWNTFALTAGTPSNGIYSGPGVTGNSFNSAAAGVGIHSIIYTVTDTNGCIGSDTSFITVNLCDGIYSPATLNISLRISPNPTSGILHIETNIADYTVHIYDAAGKQVYQQNVAGSSGDADISTLPNGIYFVAVQNENETAGVKILLDK